MIKVNLLRNQGVEVAETQTFDIGSLDGGSQSQNAKKIGAMLAFVILLIGFEQFTLSELEDDYKAAVALNQQKVTESRNKQKKADEAEKAQKVIRELEDKIRVIKVLSKTRLREIKMLDMLQNIVPERLWLTQIKYQEDTINLMGYALSEDELTGFLEAMEARRGMFRDVIPLKSAEKTVGQGNVISFEINAKVMPLE